jgi:hypothetical protein
MRFPILAAVVFSLFLLQGDESLHIDSPPENGTVFGTVEIKGTAAAPGMTCYRVDFAYEQNPTNTWFPIAEGTEPVQNGTLVEWDTSQIREGTYSLRLTAYLQDGSIRQAVANGIRVRRAALPTQQNPQETVIPVEPDGQSAGRAAAIFPAPTAAVALGPLNSSEPISFQEIAFLSGGGLALLAFGLFWFRSRWVWWKHRRLVLQIRKNESNHE